MIRAGHFDASEYLIKDYFIPKKIDISKQVISTAKYMQSTASRIFQTSQNFFNKAQEVVPVFKWAQSFTEVFIHVKYAHRHDAPSCLETFNKKFTQDENRLIFEISCLQGTQHIKYYLDFPLQYPVVAKDSKIKDASVGTTVITLHKKKEERVWRWLSKKNAVDKKGRRVKHRIWYEAQKTYSSVANAYNSMLNKEEELKESKEWERKVKKNFKKKISIWQQLRSWLDAPVRLIKKYIFKA